MSNYIIDYTRFILIDYVDVVTNNYCEHDFDNEKIFTNIFDAPIYLPTCRTCSV